MSTPHSNSQKRTVYLPHEPLPPEFQAIKQFLDKQKPKQQEKKGPYGPFWSWCG